MAFEYTVKEVENQYRILLRERDALPLSTWEKTFIEDLEYRHANADVMTPKQRAQVSRIYVEKYEGA